MEKMDSDNRLAKVLAETKQRREAVQTQERAMAGGRQDALKDWPDIVGQIERESANANPLRNLKECCVIVGYVAKGESLSSQMAYDSAYQQAIQELLLEGFNLCGETCIFPNMCGFSIRW